MASLKCVGVHADSSASYRETFSLRTDSEAFIVPLQTRVSSLACLRQFLRISFCLCLSQNQEIEELTKICDELIAKLGTE